MIPRECKRLAEIDFPIAAVSKHALREKSAPKGYPSTLHLWWARRPLASCRAMMLALLLPDPCDEHCPDEFKAASREILRATPGRIGSSDAELRQALLDFIGDFANWEHAANPTFLEVGRGLVKAAHPDETPLVVDPFAGGGSIPLEALRLGCDTFASDLNPVACLILKTMLEDIPRHRPGLADELRRIGAEIEAVAEKELGQFYPRDLDGSRPIAYLWARTVRCEAPNCGAEIPLARSFWLSKKAGRLRALGYQVVRSGGAPPHLSFEVLTPKAESEVPRGTVTRARATCPCCGTTLAPDRVRSQLSAQRGGADVKFDDVGRRVRGATMLAVVAVRPGVPGRLYRLPTERDYGAVYGASSALERIVTSGSSEPLSPIPNEPTPKGGGSGAGRAFSVQAYGMAEWGDLFTERQKVALVKLIEFISNAAIGSDHIKRLLAEAFDRVAMSGMSLTRWNAVGEKMQHTFGRQALPIVWDFTEIVPVTKAPGNWQSGYDLVGDVISKYPPQIRPGQAEIADAARPALPLASAALWFTDPPYDDQVPYADLSDFFFVWLKRLLPGYPWLRDPYDTSNPLTPKAAEAVRDESKFVNGRPKDRAFYEAAMAQAFEQGRRVTREDGVGSVIFAHKTTEGWESLLSGMIRGGWTITASWPVITEMGTRLRARDSAALATSVHLVCRPRIEERIGDWADVLRELPERVGDWMARLEREGVRGADLVFACIGPALEIFSRYSRVETPDGREVPLKDYLEKVWEVVGRAALHQILGTAEAQARNGGAGALEEDARLTALFLWTIRSTATNGPDESAPDDEGEEETDDTDEDEGGGGKKPKGFTLIYDIARRFAQPLGIHLDAWKDRIIDIDKGVVRLLPVRDRARQLFGEDGAAGLADRIERAPATARQLELFAGVRETQAEPPRGRRRRLVAASAQAAVTEATTLDRVHTAMLLQASGRTNALRALLAAEQERGPDFVRLSNALSALYPQGTDEKRLLERDAARRAAVRWPRRQTTMRSPATRRLKCSGAASRKASYAASSPLPSSATPSGRAATYCNRGSRFRARRIWFEYSLISTAARRRS